MATTYYPKINTLFLRDLDKQSKYYNCILLDQPLTTPEFETLKFCDWECTEKIDGTNISIHIIPDMDSFKVEVHGRTDRAQIPDHLLYRMSQIATKDNLAKIIKDPTKQIILFGEGYGTKIQSVGSRYIKEGVDFILFDVLVDDIWLSRESCEEIASMLGIKIVPVIGYFTVPEATELVRMGFNSRISEDQNLPAEGLVLKAPCGILDRLGNRIITKIKTEDFNKLRAKGLLDESEATFFRLS